MYRSSSHHMNVCVPIPNFPSLCKAKGLLEVTSINNRKIISEKLVSTRLPSVKCVQDNSGT